MFYNEFADAMTSENRNENNKSHKRKIEARPLGSCSSPLLPQILKEDFLRVHRGGKTKADSLTKSIANNILTEKSDKRAPP